MTLGIPGRQLGGLGSELFDEFIGNLASTMIRSVDMQIWPIFAKAPKGCGIDRRASMSASSRMTSGALPPSSRIAGFKLRPQISPMILPTLVEPVKFTRLTEGWVISAFDALGRIFRALVITPMAPVGSPASTRALRNQTVRAGALLGTP